LLSGTKPGNERRVNWRPKKQEEDPPEKKIRARWEKILVIVVVGSTVNLDFKGLLDIKDI